MDEKRSYLDTPAYTAFLTVVAFWAAASSGTASYVRVGAGLCAAGAAAHFVRLLVERRRDRRGAAEAAEVADS
ncbi:hypothetical protein OG543_13115 [Streptomyces sp. NBC_01178]|uniref:hypothetical protein n=1 Tax=Streptomyces sp. NBC_01178 TaxID=2903762 RepID=UPI003867F05B|nr:hypothetical protein OG543_13115 [Streptomyces sp. NBC_01178]